MFTDIQGYTAMAQKNEALALELLQEQSRLLRPIFSKYEGREIKTVGDAFLVEFPSALQASNCAVEIQITLRKRNSEVSDEKKIPVRIGIHVGDVIAQEGDILGDAVNIASRIQPLAEAGGVCVSQQVYDQVYNKVDLKLQSIGKHELKNVEGKVQVYKVSLPWDEEIPPGDQKRVLSLIDRRDEMGSLQSALERSAEGEGGLLLVAGEAGIGKTRLADEISSLARKKGATVLTGRCHRREGNAPYTPWVELMREFVKDSTPRDLVRLVGSHGSEVARLVPEVTDKIGPVSAALAGLAEQDKLRFFDGIAQVINNLTKDGPVLLVLEDLNWADVASLDLLQYFARATKGWPLMVLGTYRDVELEEDSPLSEVLYELKREKIVETLRLKGLTPDDVAKMVKEFFGTKAEISNEFRDLIYQKTGGNPFFIEEVLRSFVEQGVVYRTGEGWERKEISEIQIPSGVKMVIKQRLNHLDQDCQGVLSIASVTSCASKDFTFDLLQKVTGIDEDRLLDLMDRILKSRLIGETSSHLGRYAYEFTDLRIRDALYEEMSLARRSRYHLKTGQAMEEIYAGRLEEGYGILAYHYLKGNDHSKSLSFSIKAAEEAARLYAHKEAIRYYQIALDLLEGDGDKATRAKVLEELGDSYWLSAMWQLCLSTYEKAALLSVEIGDKKRAARIYAKMGSRAYDAHRADSATPRAYFQKALSLMKDEGEGEELASLYQSIARFDWLSGDFAESDSYSRKALALAEKFGLREVEAHTYLDMAVTAPPAEKEKKVRNMQKALQLGLENSYVDVVLRAYNNLLVEAGTEEAFEIATKGLEYAKRVGYIGWQINFETSMGDYYRNIGDLQKAEETARRVLAESVAIESRYGEDYASLLLGSVLLVKGDLRECEEVLERFRSRVAGTKDFQNAIWSEFSVGCLDMEKGDLARAEEHLSKAWRDSVSAGIHGMSTYLVSLSQILDTLVGVEADLGKLQEARTHLEDLEKIVAQTDDPRALACAHDAKGRVLALEGNHGMAVEELKKSLGILKEQKDVYPVIMTNYALGVACQKAGDSPGAEKAFREALDLSERIGSSLYTQRILSRMNPK
jgi:tetratricopeptide (TPR) repeat protein